MKSDWLTQLAPAHAPAAPPWWPPAVGWWVLLGAILALAAASMVWWRVSPGARRWRVRRAALAELNRIRVLDEEEQRAPEVQRLMRRYAITAYGAAAVANLSGDAWLRFVKAHGGAGFGGSNGERFLAAAFGGATPHTDPDWFSAAEAFIRHRPRRRAT